MPEKRIPRLMPIVRHRITLLLLAVALIIGALQLSAPALTRHYAVSWLQDHGAAHARIAHIRLNLWLGRLSVEGLKAGDGLSIEHAAIDIDWWPLWHHRLDLRALQLDGARLHLVQRADGAWAPAGLRPPSPTASGHPWQLILHRVQLRHVRIMLNGKAMKAEIPIEQLTLTQASMSPTGAQVLNAALTLGRGSLAIGGYRAAGDSAMLQGQLTLPADTLPPGARHLAIRAQGLHLAAGKAAVDIGRMLVSGISTKGTGDIQAGSVEMQAIQADALPHGIHASIDAIDAEPVKLQAGGIRIAKVRLDGLRAAAPEGLSLGTIRQATLDGLSLGSDRHAAFSGMELQGIDLPATTRHSLGRIDGITATGADIDGGLSLDSLAVRGMDMALLHRKSGMAVIDRLQALAAAPAAPGAKGAKPQGPAAGQAPRLRIGSIVIDDASRIRLHDAAIEPPFVTHLKVESFKLAGFDTQGNTPSTLTAALQLGDEGKLTLQGSFRLQGGLKAADMTLAIQRLSMPPLSGYTERDFGNAINTGQMNLHSQVHIHGDTIQAQNKLAVRNLVLKATPEAGKKTQALGMPLGMAVDMLRNDRGDITLDVPVSGRLHDPNVHLSDAFDQALASAMRSAALSSASLLLQPYGSILPALSMASSLIGQVSRPRLTPIAFAPRTAALSEQARAYIERIAVLLKKKKGFRLQACGVAASGDFPGGALPAKGSSAYNGLLTLATARSSQIVKALVAAGIDPGRLFSCRPQIDANAAEGRVELLLN